MPKTRGFKFAALLLMGMIGAIFLRPSFAQELNQVEQANFDRFLNNHTAVAKELAKDPNLVRDPQYVSERPALKAFLQTHPNIRRDVESNPGAFANNAGHYEWKYKPLAFGDRGGPTQAYFVDHQDVARELEANPELLKDPKYVAAHPGLKEYMEQHPNLQSELKEHPYAIVGGRGRGKGYGN